MKVTITIETEDLNLSDFFGFGKREDTEEILERIRKNCKPAAGQQNCGSALGPKETNNV